MKRRVLKTRNIILFITVFLSTLMIEFILVFLQGCSDGVGLAFDIDKQAFVVEQGCVCGGCLYFSGEDAADEFSVIYNKNVHAFWYDSYNPSVLISIISPPVAVLFCMTIRCYFIVCHCCQIQLITSIVCLVVAGYGR